MTLKNSHRGKKIFISPVLEAEILWNDKANDSGNGYAKYQNIFYVT